MEDLVSPPCQKQPTQMPRRCPSHNQDLWLVVREGFVSDVDSALLLLKKNGGNINARNSSGLTPLHIATWRNHVPIVRRLLEAGADPNARDGESGWSSLHRALHFGNLAVACVLLQSGASFALEDVESRIPVDLLSGPVLQAVGKEKQSIATEVLSWGSGTNYQLGTGNAHIQKLPCKVDSLHGSFIEMISAAKFHSVAVSAHGEVYTWGFGRGGRLGHPDFDIHSGQAAVITPRQVTGLGRRRVTAIAAAKHHTVVATEGGEVFTWGSNREGQLGYTSVDTQPTPRRVSSLKARIVAVAAANKHSAVVSDAGEIYTWGCNKEGQLGYGTSNSASNYTPRVIEYLKGKSFTEVAAAKYHTVVLGTDGEVFTWGHRLVNPRRVVITRNIKEVEDTEWKFHRKERLNVAAIAAGVTHSSVRTDDGALFYWASSDPDLKCHQLYSPCGRSIVNISAGKYWTAAVTDTGDVYMRDGKEAKVDPPTLTRLHGLKKATSVSVGETHLLIVSSLYHPSYPPSIGESSQKLKVQDELSEMHEGFIFYDGKSQDVFCSMHNDDDANRPVLGLGNFSENRRVPSLKSLCEKMAAEHLVEPRNALQLLEIADSLGADDLKKHCEDIAIRNLDYILTVSTPSFVSTSLDLLVDLEKLLEFRSSEPWSHRQLPTPTASFPAIINSDEEDGESDFLWMHDHGTKNLTFEEEGNQRLDGFPQSYDAGMEGVSKQIRALRKKLQQIELLEEKLSKGHLLDDQQIAKLQTRPALEISLAELGAPIALQAKAHTNMDERVSKRGVSRKQSRKSKQKAASKEEESSNFASDAESGSVKSFLEAEVQRNTSMVKDVDIVSAAPSEETKDSPYCNKKPIGDTPKNKNGSPATSRKKNRKGGLSMFLSGALDDTPKSAAPAPVITKSEGPAWGGAKISPMSTSLREIQDEQSKIKEAKPTKKKEVPLEDMSDANVSGKLPLGSLLATTPIPMAPSRKGQVSDGERNTPPWAASGTPPSLSRPSLRDIQLQQVKKQQCLSHSPKTRTTGFSVTTGQGSPSESSGVNRWFIPETDAPSSIRSIQIEEKAIKDLKRFYSSVRIVKNQS